MNDVRLSVTQFSSTHMCTRISEYLGVSVETVNLGNGGPRGEVTIFHVRCFHGLLFTGEAYVV